MFFLTLYFITHRHQIAEENRNAIRLEFIAQLNEIKDRFDDFTKELNETCENGYFFEQDIERLANKLQELKQETDRINVICQFKALDSVNWFPIVSSQHQEKSSKSYLNNSQLLLERKIISLHDRKCFFLAASNIHILAYILSISRNENRLILYDTDGHELNSTALSPRYGHVCDIIYAEKLHQSFIVVCRKAIYVYNPQKMQCTIMPEIKSTDEHPFWSITVSSNTHDAFISLDINGYIERWSTETHPIWTLIQRWNTKEILESSDQGIRMIRVCTNKTQLAVAVLQEDKSSRIDLFDFDLKLVARGRKLDLVRGLDKSNLGCRLTNLPGDNNENDSWLLTERSTNTLWYVDGSTLRQIDKNVHGVCLMEDKNQQPKIAISYDNEPQRIEVFSL